MAVVTHATRRRDPSLQPEETGLWLWGASGSAAAEVLCMRNVALHEVLMWGRWGLNTWVIAMCVQALVRCTWRNTQRTC